MTQQALGVLDHIILETSKRKERFTEFLKDPSQEYAVGWYMCLPSCFNDTLDIKLTPRVQDKQKGLIWTQGSSFSFKDTLYDTPDAYKVWAEALKTMRLCIQVQSACNAGIIKGTTKRSPGSVTFSLFSPNAVQSKIVQVGKHRMSQDDFVRFVIAGPSRELKSLFLSHDLF